MVKRIVLLVLVLLLGWSSGASATPVITNGLVAGYEFNGNADDVSGNGNNGLVHGATLTTDRFGNANSAYSFDGVNDYVSVPYSASFDFSQSKEISFGAWVHLETNTGGNIIYHPSPSTHFAFSIDIYKEGQANTNHVGGELHVTNPPNWELAVSPEEIDFNSWQHLFVTADEDYLRLYMNGSEVREVALGGDWITNNFEEDTIIGATKLYYLPNPTDQFVDGKIDEVYVYNRALSASEVLTLATVPEPNTALLLGVGLMGLGMRRRRQRTHWRGCCI